MAKQEKELTVEERLKSLYDLQKTLSEVDRIKTERGELPLEVQDLEDEIEGLQTRIGNFKDEIEQLNTVITNQQNTIDQSGALIEKYEKDQDNVRNNREYDYLTKEIEFQQLSIQSAQKKIDEASHKIDAIKAQIDAAQTQLSDNEQVLAEKKGELDTIIADTKQEEEKQREKAKKLETKINNADPRLLSAFKRIRKNARNGLGVVYVQRNACGGCFNRIPAQRQMEIKMRKKIIVCEYCGRILIDPAIAGVSDIEAKNS
ncbi:MAG: C4-type zinc ribbon domain-containing protein [Bacteroidales bacterium]|nr:C4-type zinc ribbon domain-containing protein [Bacteroidales bacterium]